MCAKINIVGKRGGPVAKAVASRIKRGDQGAFLLLVESSPTAEFEAFTDFDEESDYGAVEKPESVTPTNPTGAEFVPLTGFPDLWKCLTYVVDHYDIIDPTIHFARAELTLSGESDDGSHKRIRVCRCVVPALDRLTVIERANYELAHGLSDPAELAAMMSEDLGKEMSKTFARYLLS